MRILGIGKGWDGGGLLWRMKQDGHEIAYWRGTLGPMQERRGHAWHGLKPRDHALDVLFSSEPKGTERMIRDLTSWNPLDPVQVAAAYKPDFCLFDTVGLGRFADTIRNVTRIPTIGGGQICDDWEYMRGLGSQVLADCGMELPESERFADYAKAIEWLEDQDEGGWVLKWDGNASMETHLEDSNTAMVTYIERLQTDRSVNPKGGFHLQLKLKGVEVSTEVIWDGEQAVCYDSTFEDKLAYAGDTGMVVGCTSDTVVLWDKENLPKLVKQTAVAFEKALREASAPPNWYDVNVIIDVRDGKPKPLEITPRRGLNAGDTWAELVNEDLGDLLCDIANGDCDGVHFHEGEYAASYRVGIPPYPWDASEVSSKAKGPAGEYRTKIAREVMLEQCKDVPIVGPVDEHVWLGDVKMANEQLVCAGTDGNLMTVTARGRDVNEARRAALAHVRRFTIPKMWFREDGSQRVVPNLKTLIASGLVDEDQLPAPLVAPEASA